MQAESDSKGREEAIRSFKKLQVQFKDAQMGADEVRNSQEAMAARVKEMEKRLRVMESDLSQSQEVLFLTFSPYFSLCS